MALKEDDAISRLAEALLAGNRELVDELKANRPPRQIKIGERKETSVFNPSGKARSLKRETYVNRFPVDTRYLHDDEIALLNAITPGKYLKKLVRVSEHEQGDQTILHIQYPDLSRDDRMMMKGVAPTFANLLQQIIAEAKASAA